MRMVPHSGEAPIGIREMSEEVVLPSRASRCGFG